MRNALVLLLRRGLVSHAADVSLHSDCQVGTMHAFNPCTEGFQIPVPGICDLLVTPQMIRGIDTLQIDRFKLVPGMPENQLRLLLGLSFTKLEVDILVQFTDRDGDSDCGGARWALTKTVSHTIPCQNPRVKTQRWGLDLEVIFELRQPYMSVNRVQARIGELDLTCLNSWVRGLPDFVSQQIRQQLETRLNHFLATAARDLINDGIQIVLQEFYNDLVR